MNPVEALPLEDQEVLVAVEMVEMDQVHLDQLILVEEAEEVLELVVVLVHPVVQELLY